MTRRQFRAGLILATVAVLSAALALPAQVALADSDECEASAELTENEAKLPRLAERLHAHAPVTIVAIGGASTIGSAAGSPEQAYPHRLELALAHWYPDEPITVVNKGVPRQSAGQMLARFPTDVIAEDPVLVIWETGITDAVRGTNIDDFAATLQTGIDELKNRAIDIILVDMQFSRSSTTVIDFEQYLSTLHRLGDLTDVYVFPRFAMMRYWSEENLFNFDEVDADDRAKLAARVYDCIGVKLAQVIRRAVQ